MKKRNRNRLVYLGGMAVTAAALIPANLPFTLYLKNLAARGENRILSEYFSRNDISRLPLELWGRFFYTFSPFLILLAVLLIWWKLVHREKLIRLFTASPRFRFSLAARSCLLWLILAAFSDLVIFGLSRENYTLRFSLSSWLRLILVGLPFILIQISFEEVFFRGYLIKGGTAFTGRPILSLVLVSLLFGLLHMANPEAVLYGPALMLPQYAGMGLFLAGLTWHTDGLEPALGIHLANNCWGLLVVNSGGTAFETLSPVLINQWNPLYSLIALAFSVSVFLIILTKTGFLMAKKSSRVYFYPSI